MRDCELLVADNMIARFDKKLGHHRRQIEVVRHRERNRSLPRRNTSVSSDLITWRWRDPPPGVKRAERCASYRQPRPNSRSSQWARAVTNHHRWNAINAGDDFDKVQVGPHHQLSQPFFRNHSIASWADSSSERNFRPRSLQLAVVSKCMLCRVSFTPVTVAMGT